MFINKINTYNKSYSFGNSEKQSKDKNYYTYSTKTTNLASDREGYKLLGITLAGAAAIFGGAAILHKKVVSKQLTKAFTEKTPKTLINITYWLVSGIIAFKLPIAVLEKSLTKTKKLKPLSESEQVEKEKQIKKTVSELEEQKNVKLNGITFQDFPVIYSKQPIMAAFDAKTGYLILNSKFKDTNLDMEDLKPVVIHELTHAKQNELMARADIYNFNRAAVISGANSLSPQKKQEWLNENLSEIEKTYKDEDLMSKEQQINAFNAIKMYLQNPDISTRDLSMLIDEKYYNKVIKDKPPLTLEEKQKAQKYLEYMEKQGKGYDKVKGVDYLQNPMEKEAFNNQYTYIKTGKVI